MDKLTEELTRQGNNIQIWLSIGTWIGVIVAGFATLYAIKYAQLQTNIFRIQNLHLAAQTKIFEAQSALINRQNELLEKQNDINLTQSMTSNEQLKLDLFNVRYEVYEVTRYFIADFIRDFKVEASLSNKFKMAIMRSGFLFDSLS